MLAILHDDLSSSSLWILVMTGAVLGTTLTLLLVLGLLVFFFVCYYSGHGDHLHLFLYTFLGRRRRQLLPQTIILVRHGESIANVDKRIWQSLPDNLVSLTERGKAQATAVGQRIEALFRAKDEQAASRNGRRRRRRHNDDDNNNKPTTPAGSIRRIHFIVSPFERTLQTASCMRPALQHRIVRTDIESRIREQEMGNLQHSDEFPKFRAQQKRVGRFWYRFPTGESGSDVLDRTKSWWFETVLQVNQRVGYDPVDALVVVTHGLTMRFILMQLFGWSPTTFHSVWNAGNCSMYVLERDDSKPGQSPYVLDATAGDMPRSSIEVLVQLKPTTTTKQSSPLPPPSSPMVLTLDNYLSVPPPRTTRTVMIGHMLAAQYPEQIPSADEIESILFLPFIEGGVVKGRSTSGSLSRSGSRASLQDEQKQQQQQRQEQQQQRHATYADILSETDARHASSLSSLLLSHDNILNKSDTTLNNEDDESETHHNNDTAAADSDDDDHDLSLSSYPSLRYAKPEMSLRFPCFQIPEEAQHHHHHSNNNNNNNNSRIISSSSITTMDARAKRLRFFLQEHETFDSSFNNKNNVRPSTATAGNNNDKTKKSHESAPLLLPELSPGKRTASRKANVQRSFALGTMLFVSSALECFVPLLAPQYGERMCWVLRFSVRTMRENARFRGAISTSLGIVPLLVPYGIVVAYEELSI
eukprot:scaffold875_cov185-Amphora_coffeaeformis.AAC.13